MDIIKNSSVLRWIMFFPAAVVAAIVAHLGIRVILLLQGYLGGIGDSLWLYFVLNEASHLALGYLFVAVGVAVVPTYRPIILALHFCILSAVFSIFTIQELSAADNLINYVDTVGLASVIVGGGYYWYQYINEEFVLFWKV